MGERRWALLFEPRSVAVVGASNTPGKIGMVLMSTLVSGGFKGEIYPVNPRAEEVLGLEGLPER